MVAKSKDVGSCVIHPGYDMVVGWCSERSVGDAEVAVICRELDHETDPDAHHSMDKGSNALRQRLCHVQMLTG